MSGNPVSGNDWLAEMLAAAAPKAVLDLQDSAPAPAELADGLRRRLALRGRTPPAELLPDGLSTAERQAVLSAVLPDCDSGPSNEGWLLRDAPRRTVLGGLRPDELQTLVAADPAPADSTWQALNVLGTKVAQAVATLPSDVLRGLLRILDTLGSAHAEALPIQIDAVRWQLARKTRRDGYARLGSGFIGRRWERWHLRTFLEQPIPNERAAGSPSVQSLVLHGAGGAGKSALLAAVLGPMLDRHPDLALVHLDFDRPALDPLVPTSLDIELLRQVGQVDRDMDKRMHQVRADIRAALQDTSGRRGLSLEAVGSDGLAAFDSSLKWLQGASRPLLLVLDTVEQVQAGGPARMRALLDWIGRVAAVSGAPELRVVLAGRDDPTPWLTPRSALHLRGQSLKVQEGGFHPDDRARTRRLSDLKPADAGQLLQSRGVPASNTTRLVQTFGGNPLILRLVADLAVRGDPLDTPAGQLPAALVQGYLYDRILKHIGEEARPFAHPGLVLPALTAQMIEEVLGPVKGEPDLGSARAQSIFEALIRPGWLMQRTGDAVRLRPDLRRLTLQLIASDPARHGEMQDVHRAAQRWHTRHVGPEHQGMALYHALMLDPSAMPDALPKEIEQVLLPLLDDLPDAARATLRARSDQVLGEDVAAAQLSDQDWADYLAQDGGAGAMLASTRTPDEVLQLWRSRPSGPTGEPPTPVLQALAEAGEWDGNEANLDLIGHKLSLGPEQGRKQRLYWACCLALLRQPYRLPPKLWDALRSGLLPERERVPWQPAEMIRLAALASLLEPSSLPSLHRESGAIVEPRVAQALLSMATPSQPIAFAVALDGLVVLQADWKDRVYDAVGRAAAAFPLGIFEDAQSKIRQLNGRRLGDVAPMLRRFSSIRVRLDISDGTATDTSRALLLRDVTAELHRPAREALRQAFPSTDQARIVLEQFRPLLSICPAELEPEPLLDRIARDPAGWWLQVVQFADQARVLGSLLDLAHEAAPDVTHLARVARTFHVWDAALGTGLPSAWTRQDRKSAIIKQDAAPMPRPSAATSDAMLANPRVLLIEGDEATARQFMRGFQRAGIQVAWANSGAAGMTMKTSFRPDIVLVELTLPDVSGVTLIGRLAEARDCGVIVVSGMGDEADRIVGLELGADDYIAKPPAMRDMIARIRAVHRRVNTRHDRAPAPAQSAVMSIGPIRINLQHRTVHTTDGRRLHLTSAEFAALETLAAAAGQPVSRDRLSVAALRRAWQAEDSSVDQLVFNLRQKLPPDENGTMLIQSIRGSGYWLLPRLPVD